jgi:hypothetical protein
MVDADSVRTEATLAMRIEFIGRFVALDIMSFSR